MILKIAALALILPALAFADLKPELVRVADGKKSGYYIQDGMVTGGDQAIDEVVVKDIRRAVNPGFERIVIDLEGTKNGEAAAIPRPPYYQVSVNSDENRLIFSVWGKPKVQIDSRKAVSIFKKSPVVQSLNLLPPMDPDVWTFVIELKGQHPVEVFELTNPVRIIVDIKIR